MTFYDKNEDIINALSSKHRVERDLIEQMINHTFLSVREAMALEEMPNILLHNWGRFFPRLRHIENKLLKYSIYLRKGGILNDYNFKRLRAFLSAYDRLCNESKRVKKDFEYLKEQVIIYEARNRDEEE